MTSTTPRWLNPLLFRSIERGAGPTLLLLHGVTRCGEDWQPLMPTLAASWKVIALDQRGHGESPRGGDYLVDDYVADAVRIIRDELATPLVIFGHSLGAMVAAAVAAELPQQVRGIVLEDPPFHMMGNRIAGSLWQSQFIGMREAARRGGGIDEITDALAEIRLPRDDGGYKRLGEVRDRASLQWSAQCLSQIDPAVLTPVIEGRWLDGYDMPAVFSRIQCPTLLLQADPRAGGALIDTDAEVASAAITSCQLVRFSGCGHQLHRDRPEDVLETFAKFAFSFTSLEKLQGENLS
ncbi:alpha/beta hydrolase [Rhodopirellula sp.]|nr:alpha/beta hydrolase [Rhodopirellula sp.]MDB4394039.1 alpha/beta hydrolase [Rhodopirellula sp.]